MSSSPRSGLIPNMFSSFTSSEKRSWLDKNSGRKKKKNGLKETYTLEKKAINLDSLMNNCQQIMTVAIKKRSHPLATGGTAGSQD